MQIKQSEILVLALLLIYGQLFAQSKNQMTNKEVTMNAKQNKEIVLKIYESFNTRNMAALNDLISADYTGVNNVKGAPGFQQVAEGLIKAFPNAKWNINSVIAEDDNVFIKWKFEGTHLGAFQNIVPTNKKVSTDGMAILKLKDGKVISSDVHTDRFGFLQQLDVLPVDINSFTKKNTSNYIRLVDTFVVPPVVFDEFIERVKVNRNFIKSLNGFIKDEAFQRSDETGNIIYMTVAVWENDEAIKRAKEALQVEYAKEGFNVGEFVKRLNITLDRGIFKEATDQ